MANITSYPTVTPTGSDLVIGTDMSTTPISTKTFTIDSINSLAYDATFPFVFNTTSKTGIQSTGNTASGTNSMVMGFNTLASGDQSTAMGEDTKALGDSSLATGDTTTASGTNSTAMGFSTVASGDSSLATGRSAIASGNVSTAMGESATASGISSTAMGENTAASGTSSTAMGNETEAVGASSTAMGESTTAFGYASTSMGHFNVLNTSDNAAVYAATNTAFSIGNGTSEAARSDAFKVLFNGTTTTAGSVTSESLNVTALNAAPASASAAGTLGSIRFTADHIYVCVATNTWKRVSIATF